MRPIGAVPITGEVTELSVIDGELSEIPTRMLESVRELRIVWFDDLQETALAELPRLTPQLERLSLSSYGDEWAWPEAPQVLGALPQLRAFEVDGGTVRELSERARMFPDLCVLADEWPLSAGRRA